MLGFQPSAVRKLTPELFEANMKMLLKKYGTEKYKEVLPALIKTITASYSKPGKERKVIDVLSYLIERRGGGKVAPETMWGKTHEIASIEEKMKEIMKEEIGAESFERLGAKGGSPLDMILGKQIKERMKWTFIQLGMKSAGTYMKGYTDIMKASDSIKILLEEYEKGHENLKKYIESMSEGVPFGTQTKAFFEDVLQRSLEGKPSSDLKKDISIQYIQSILSEEAKDIINKKLARNLSPEDMRRLYIGSIGEEHLSKMLPEFSENFKELGDKIEQFALGEQSAKEIKEIAELSRAMYEQGLEEKAERTINGNDAS